MTLPQYMHMKMNRGGHRLSVLVCLYPRVNCLDTNEVCVLSRTRSSDVRG